MDFNSALKIMTEAPETQFKREKWRSKYIILITNSEVDKCVLHIPEHRSYKIRPFLLIKTKYDYEFAVFVPTMEELMATDWSRV